MPRKIKIQEMDCHNTSPHDTTTPPLQISVVKREVVASTGKRSTDDDDDESVLLLNKEVTLFDVLVKQRTGFKENMVTVYGSSAGSSGTTKSGVQILSPLCLVPEGIKYDVRGKTHIFDSVTHIITFIAYGDPEGVGKWSRGGVMSDFITMFGEDHGQPMKAKYGDMIGHLPLLIVKPGRTQLRAAHGIKLKESVEPITDYDLWRPILHAKFSCPSARDSLLETGMSYLIDKDSSCDEWGGKIVYPEPKHNTNGKCTCRSTPAKNCPLTKEHLKQKKAGTRTGGVLMGRNRMGKYIMAIRAEVRLIGGKRDAPAVGTGDQEDDDDVKEMQCGGGVAKKARKNDSTTTF